MIAEALQEPLLKIPPSVTGLRYGHLYKSATTSTKVGGDFHDLLPLSEDVTLLLIGDVAGKGLEAANLTTVVKATVRAYARQGDSPAEIMRKANDVVISAMVTPPFVTTFIGLLDHRSGQLTYCNAGHTLPLLRRTRPPSTEFLQNGTPPIGIFAWTQYQDKIVTLEAHDRLVLYTDGIVEARTGGELYGEGRLAKIVEDNDSKDIVDLPGIILDDAARFSNAELHDDIAIMTIALDWRVRD